MEPKAIHSALFLRLNGPAEVVPTALPRRRCQAYAEGAMSIRVFIIDEHSLARQMLARRLASSPNIEVIGSTGDSQEGLRQIKELAPDVVLLDTKMRNANGMDVCRRACAANGKTKVAVLTSYTDPEELRMAYQLGISGYLLKEVGTDMLVAQLRRMVGLNE